MAGKKALQWVDQMDSNDKGDFTFQVDTDGTYFVYLDETDLEENPGGKDEKENSRPLQNPLAPLPY